MCAALQLSVHGSVSHRPGMGEEVELSAAGALLAVPQGKAETCLKGMGHTGRTAAISNPSFCPSSLTLTLVKGSLQPHRKLECRVKNKDPSPPKK